MIGQEVQEYAIGMSGGSMQIRPDDPEVEEEWPLARWIPSHQRNGGKVFVRRIVVIEGWREVPR